MSFPTDARRLLRRTGFDVIRWPHRPEAGVTDWALAEVLRTRQVNVVIDAGGNRGQFARRLRGLGYSGRIVSFEPSPTVLPVITERAARDPEWIVRPVGLSSRAGEAELRLHKEAQLDSLLDLLPTVTEQHFPGLGTLGTATIRLSTLEAEFPGIIGGIDEPRVLLKADIQGHEAEMLHGAGDQGLDEAVVAAFVELVAQPVYDGQATLGTVLDLIMKDGFVPVAFEPLFESSDGLRIVELDALFIRPASSEPDWGYGKDTRPYGIVPASSVPATSGR
jgi:FkbM family methyltransferase